MNPPLNHEFVALYNRHRAEADVLLGKDARDIAKHAGFATLLTLVGASGGARMKISRYPHRAKETRLAKIVGAEKAAVLIRVFRGDRITIPTVGRMLSIYRRLLGPELIAKGRNHPQVASALGASYSLVAKMAARLRKKNEAVRVVR
jgi:transposase